MRNVLIDQGMQKVFRSANLPMLDWRQLRRRGISEDQASTGNVIKFKEESYWDLYKWRVMGVISICVVEALLILLNISSRTVESHKYEIMEAIGVQTNAELVQYAIKIALVFVAPAPDDNPQ
ncbi:MAG TPA: hypothetical protein VFS27_02445 [Blastocatellia bacterium]|nr:hypothetical protein [Blastocatellia bacterium]